MASEFLCALLAGWVLQAWWRPAACGEDLAKIVRAYRAALKQEP